ncbi:MAG TPA: hypothetical protein PKW35_21085 [Nannocystaceae bacterium]|nr:hypothetical protein [Nannocystaceae bacterium]
MKFKVWWTIAGALALGACNGGDDGGGDGTATSTASTTAGTGSTSASTTSASTTASSETGTGTASASDSGTTGTTGTSTATTATTDPTGTGTTGTTGTGTTDPGTTDATTAVTGTTGGGCGVCNEPNQECINDVCVTSCQGQDPDPCGPNQACDVISGECKDLDATCSLAGGYTACDGKKCGPGTVCDGLGQCVAIAPCAGVECTGGGECWGALCSCTRKVECEEPSLQLMNGPFSVEMGGLDFADDCNAWMVTLRSGPDYLRRLTPMGTLTTWTGVSNLNMGEVRVLKRLTVPQAKELPPWTLDPPVPPEPQPVMGLGEVAITYTCCPTCGCQANPPQGVARLVEEDMVNPLPIVIVAKATQGNGPFGNTAADAGPHGLTWGEDRVLYVGNSTDNGDWNTADLDKMQQAKILTFPSRVTAAAPVSPAHIVVGLIGGDIMLYNVNTQQADFLADAGDDITSLSHDSFTGMVYGGLRNLDIIELHPFSGDIVDYGKMPAKGRVAVSPSGKLWFYPIKYINNVPLQNWPLPASF